MIINDLDCDVESISPDDFSGESLETVQYMVAQAELNRTG
jgi:hypothetical protein